MSSISNFLMFYATPKYKLTYATSYLSYDDVKNNNTKKN